MAIMKTTSYLLCLWLMAFGMATAQPTTFDEAKALSASQGKPILLEFVRTD
jgi:hypothetical protein